LIYSLTCPSQTDGVVGDSPSPSPVRGKGKGKVRALSKIDIDECLAEQEEEVSDAGEVMGMAWSG
jgi:hypothetical protein